MRCSLLSSLKRAVREGEKEREYRGGKYEAEIQVANLDERTHAKLDARGIPLKRVTLME